MKTFHRDLGFPDWLSFPTGMTVALAYSDHALRAAEDDRYGRIRLPKGLDLSRAIVVEATVEENPRRVTKLLYRLPGGHGMDLVLVVCPQRGAWFVKTVWLNASDDQHQTLDRSRYAVPVAA